MLIVDGIDTYYGDSHILHQVSLQVPKGTLSVILGRNGVGKTTTIRSIIGLTPPRNGKIIFKGVAIERQPPFKIARLGIGLVPQGRGIFPNLTVYENLTLAARRRQNGDRWTLEEIYRLFPRLKERAGHFGGHLSGGEQQMLSIGRALLTHPDLLLLDEPSEGLSPMMVQEITGVLSMLKSEGLSILLVEQNLSMALALADHLYILSKGQVVFSGTPGRLKQSPDVMQAYLGIEG
ncbi:MAG: ABC transporter ATP-binding protein [Hydrogenibacillus schlegelii]|uniref:ABC transporter ATP-binding protein n=1 Tax=Hydrogenibacillus schlegelii TaxID=1484 RepID=A0A947D0F2_HYDSH|nr:ABC transporter ATP-binding protein [Hydrogenibacillus schlegelii]